MVREDDCLKQNLHLRSSLTMLLRPTTEAVNRVGGRTAVRVSVVGPSIPVTDSVVKM